MVWRGGGLGGGGGGAKCIGNFGRKSGFKKKLGRPRDRSEDKIIKSVLKWGVEYDQFHLGKERSSGGSSKLVNMY
jgi:hypothetical protein